MLFLCSGITFTEILHDGKEPFEKYCKDQVMKMVPKGLKPKLESSWPGGIQSALKGCFNEEKQMTIKEIYNALREEINHLEINYNKCQKMKIIPKSIRDIKKEKKTVEFIL